MNRNRSLAAFVIALALCIFPLSAPAYAADIQPSGMMIYGSGGNGDDGATRVALKTSSSRSVSFGGGVTLTANAWIQPLSDLSGCGQFQTSVVMNATPSRIRNHTSFYEIGIGALSIKGLNIESSRSGTNSLTWTNDNGARGSYLSGSVCGGWGALYVGMEVQGTAFYNGTVRVVSTKV